jgi:nuclear pore complex protein Nup98-Nup96
MARFRAFLTDSESEADETTQNATTATRPPVKSADVAMTGGDAEVTDSESESDSGEPSSGHRKRTANALVLRRDEKNYRRSKSRRSISPTDVSASEEESVSGSEGDSPPPNQPQVDHSIIPRAQQLGVEPQRMHVMQASLFRNEGGMEGAPARHKALVPARSLSLSRKHSRDSDGEGLRHDSQQVSVCPG